MKKIIALALALIMALSMGVIALADTAIAGTPAFGEKLTYDVAPFDSYYGANGAKRDYKVSYDFTSSADGYKGASLIDSVVINKDNNVEVTLKENLTKTDAVAIKGEITLTNKKVSTQTYTIIVDESVANVVAYIEGTKKADAAANIWDDMDKNTVLFAEDAAGYVKFDNGVSLAGTVKVAKDEKAQVYVLDAAETETADEDLYDAIDAYLGEDYDAIVEWYNFCGTGFDNEVAFTYEAYAEDPHYFYQWDGEKFVDLEAKFNDDEDVEAYEFTADAKGVIIVTDVEIVAAEEETKNPDTGANDVVGVAAALAVVSLVAAGAVSLKK